MLRITTAKDGHLEVPTTDQRKYAMEQLEKGYQLLMVDQLAGTRTATPVKAEEVDDQHDYIAVRHLAGG